MAEHPWARRVHHAVRLALTVAVATLWLSTQVQAQSVPDAGSILRDIQRSTPELTKPAEPAKPLVPRVEGPQVKGGQSLLLKAFRIHATLFPEARLQEVVQDYLGREVTLGDLEEAAAKIGLYYRDHGYLARAYLPKQTIQGGVVEITVLEGRLGQVAVDPSSSTRLSSDIAVGHVQAQQDVGDFIRPQALADGIANLNALPGVAATATLVPGAHESETDLLLKLEDTPLVSGLVLGDNANARAIGRWRTVGSAALNDAVGLGDQETVTLLKSTGSQYGRLALQAPLGYSGLTLGVNASALTFITAKDINIAEPGGLAVTNGMTATYPLFRNDDAIFEAQASYDHKRLVNQVFHTTTAITGVNVGGLGASGSVRDSLLGAGGVTSLGAIVDYGRLDLGDVDNQATTRSQGAYSKVTGNLGRTQPLSDDIALSLTLSGQWAHKNLDGSEKFSLGGSNGVRAYPVSEGSGDKGWLGSMELRHSPLDKVQVAAFYDVGGITQNARKWADWQGGGDQPNNYLLQGVGLWASWTPVSALTIKGTLAQVLGSNAVRSTGGYDNDGTRYRTRAWLQATATF